MYFFKNIIKWLVILLLTLDVLFILICNFNLFGCLAIKIDSDAYNPFLKNGDIAISIPRNEYDEGDVVVLTNLDNYYIEKIKSIQNNIILTTSVDGEVEYDSKNIEDVLGVVSIRINLSMVITFITTLSLGILFLIFNYYFEDKKSSKKVNP